MRIVLYNTSSRQLDAGTDVTYFPSRADEWDKTAELYPEHEIIYVSITHGLYMLDLVNSEVVLKPQKVKYVLFEENKPIEEIAELIISLAPTVAIAATLTGSYTDWNPIKDALVAELLEKSGIKTIANKTSTAVTCFDKWQTHIALRELGFNVSKAVGINNKLFWQEKTDSRISANVYKEYVLHRIKELAFPVVIKRTVGTGSVDMMIAESFERAVEILNGETINFDVIVEEFLLGEHFGAEIHGIKGKYHVLPPFSLSINASGISDGHNNVKFGPVTNEKYNIPQLQETLRRLAETFEFAGCAQVDLVFHNDKWYIIEINPRYSGMTLTYAVSKSQSLFSIYIESVLGSAVDYSKWDNLKYALNFKVPATENEILASMYAIPNVESILKYVIVNPKEELPDVFSEVILGGFDTKEELMEGIRSLREVFPDVISPTVVEEAEKLSKNG